MNVNQSIHKRRLVSRLKKLGDIGRDEQGKLTRLAASTTDQAGRDQVIEWMKEAGLVIKIDRIGNIFGIWQDDTNAHLTPMMIGSHIDTVINAGIYDGCYGVIAGIEVIETLRDAAFVPSRPIVVAAFTNEEGVRYAPDMMGSLVYAEGLSVDEALSIIGTDGTVLEEELARIGYAGTEEPGFIQPYAYIELHVEQGPILENNQIPIGAVENLQGISWKQVTIEGVANHAGTTPTDMRHDAGLAAARVITFLRNRANQSNGKTVATVGSMSFEPNAINVIPSKVKFTIDLRNPDEKSLQQEERELANYLEIVADEEGVEVTVDTLARFEPVIFDTDIVETIEVAAKQRGLESKRMTSGAGHDAQMMARITPSAMIFVPSIGGISHNPDEFTPEVDLIAGANVLLDVVATYTKESD